MNKKQDKQNEVEWDRKKIFAVLFLFVGLIIGFIVYKKLNSANDIKLPEQSTAGRSVKGTSISTVPVLDLKKNVQNQISSLKNDAQNINIVDIATSSPSVQKVINDLKAIQDYPKNQLRQTCEKICSGL